MIEIPDRHGIERRSLRGRSSPAIGSLRIAQGRAAIQRWQPATKPIHNSRPAFGDFKARFFSTGGLAVPERQTVGNGLSVAPGPQAFVENLGRKVLMPDFPAQFLR